MSERKLDTVAVELASRIGAVIELLIRKQVIDVDEYEAMVAVIKETVFGTELANRPKS